MNHTSKTKMFICCHCSLKKLQSILRCCTHTDTDTHTHVRVHIMVLPWLLGALPNCNVNFSSIHVISANIKSESNLQRPSDPAPAQAGYPGQHPGGFWRSLWRRLHNFTGQPVSMLHLPHGNEWICRFISHLKKKKQQKKNKWQQQQQHQSTHVFQIGFDPTWAALYWGGNEGILPVNKSYWAINLLLQRHWIVEIKSQRKHLLSLGNLPEKE